MASRKRPSLRDNIASGDTAVATTADTVPAEPAEASVPDAIGPVDTAPDESVPTETPSVEAPVESVTESAVEPAPVAAGADEPVAPSAEPPSEPPSPPPASPFVPAAMETVVSSASSETVESPTPDPVPLSLSEAAASPVQPLAPAPARSSGAFALAAVAAVLATAGLAATASLPYWSPDLRQQASVAQALEGRIGTVETRLGVTAAAGAPLADRVAALETSLTALDRKIAALPDTKAVGALAIAQLTAALSDSDPFATELVAIRASGIADASMKAALDSIAPRAATGIPTSDELAARFLLVVPQALAADLRAAAEELAKAESTAAAPAPAPAPAPASPPAAAPEGSAETAAADGPGLYDQMWSLLYGAADLLRVASFSGGEVRKAATVLEQTGGLVASGDLVAAVELLGTLEGAAAEAAGPWLEDARARVEADRVAALLSARGAALLPTKS